MRCEMAWEIVVRPNEDKVKNQHSHLRPTGSGGIAVKTLGSHASQDHPLHRNKAKGGNSHPHIDTPTKQQVYFPPALSGHRRTLSDGSRDVSDYLSDLDYLVYRPQPRIKRTFQPRSYRGRFSRSSEPSSHNCNLQSYAHCKQSPAQ